MGARHQQFVVARINGRYRCLAAVHHQWLYGISTLEQCTFVMKVLAAPGNLAYIRREVRLASDKEQEYWPSQPQAESEAKSGNVCFPFITDCLTKSRDVEYYSPSTPTSMHTPYNGGDNNDGITVIDITEIGKPRYAMLFLEDRYPEDDEAGEGAETMLEGMTILNGRQYLSIYLKDADRLEIESGQLQTELNEIDAWPMLDAQVLKSTWPEGDFQDSKDSPVITSAGQPEDLPMGRLSLKDVSMRNVIRRALESDPSDLDWLSEAEELHDFAKAAGSHLYAEPEAVAAPSGKVLLLRVIQDKASRGEVIDLGPFSKLNINAILDVMSKLGSEILPFSLMLPDLDTITKDQLKTIVSVDAVCELTLGRTGKLELSDILECLDGTNIRRIRTPALYARKDSDLPPLWFRHHGHLNRVHPRLTWISLIPALPRPRQFSVTQFIYARIDTNEKPRPRLPGGGLQWSGIKPRKRLVVPLALRDCFISPSMLVPMLPKMMAQFVLTKFGRTTCMVGAKVNGMLQSMSLDDDLTVSPVPGETSVWALESGGLDEYPQMAMSPLRPGEWSIIFCHEDPDVMYDPSIRLKIRYAFATLDTDGSTRVLDVEQFLHETMFAYEAKSLGLILAKWETGMKYISEARLEWRKSFLENSCERETGAKKSIDLPRAEIDLCQAEEVDQVFQVVRTENDS